MSKDMQLNIALVGNVQGEDIQLLNSILGEDDLNDICSVTLYGADGQPEDEALRDAVDDCLCEDATAQGVVCLPMKAQPKEAVTTALADDSKLLPVIIGEKMRYVISDKQRLKEDVTMLFKCLKREIGILWPRIAIVTTDEETVKMLDEMWSEERIQVFATPELKEEHLGHYDAAVVESYKEEATDITLLTGSELIAVAARPQGALKGFYLISDITRRKKEYDTARRNPLQKLFHEKKEDGDKARFASKKGFNPAEHKRENVTYVREAKGQDVSQKA